MALFVQPITKCMPSVTMPRTLTVSNYISEDCMAVTQ